MWRKNYRTWDGDDLGYGVIEFDYQIPLPTLSVDRLQFYCVGNKREIEKLLQRITHVGKKRAYGYGAVKRWQVTPHPIDNSEIVNKTLVRPIPVSEYHYQVVGEKAICGFRPPYWCPENFAKCWLPGGMIRDVSL
jgi:CRISPR type IV-associated protein Csf3